jgi:ankyrin repeat protein
MIVDQLRCGGVLEAVRVSRAGYPTRYPHDVFKARYYILGDSKDTSTVSPYGNKNRMSMDQDDMEIKRLISKIAFDIWEADHEAMMLETDSHTPIKQAKDKKSRPSLMNGHMNLVAVSTAFTPEDERKKKERAKKLRESDYNTNGMANPQTAKDFLALDFSSRCAVAGLQLGRTKVFLRREAFDRIEALRAQKFGTSAVAIQKIVRGVQARKYCQQKFAAVLTIQRAARRCLTALYERQMEHMDFSATVIQRAYRNHLNRMFYLELDGRLIPAATKIQAVVRGGSARMWYFGTLYSVMRLQAIVRGFQARSLAARLIAERHQPVASPVNSVSFDASFERCESNVTSNTRQLVPVDECQAVVAVDSEWNQLQKLVNEESWAAVEGMLDKNPNLADQVDPNNGEMLLHMISRHPTVWSLLVDMILVMYPKALIHKDSIGALPIHHAAAHDNISALEIIYSAYKEGVNDIDGSGRQPIHVAAEFDATEAVKFLLVKAPEGAFTMIHRPSEENGGGLPLHVACRHHSNMSIITTLLAENFSSAKRADENGDLPLHLLLRNGEVVEQVTVKTLLTCFASAVTRTDKNGDLPLSIAIKHECKPAVVNYLMVQYPDAAKALDGSGHSNLHLAFQHGADDRTMLGLLNHAPEVSAVVCLSFSVRAVVSYASLSFLTLAGHLD